jgi:hypothetical protein
MTLRVDPSAIRGYAKQLADLERAATTAIQYVSTYGDLNTHRTGILGEILPLHQDFVHAVKTMLARISTLADGCNVGLNQIATRYEHTDAASAAKLDATCSD